VNRYWKLLRERDYALLWGGATVSALGDGMSFVALVWLVIERGGTAADIGWLSAVYTAPVIVGGIAAGIILDRFDKRRVIAADNLIRGIAIASVPIADLLGVLTTTQLFVASAGPIVAVGASAVLAFDAGTYAVFVVCLLLMRSGGRIPVATTAHGPAATEHRARPPAVGAGIGPAVRFILGAPAIVAITVGISTIEMPPLTFRHMYGHVARVDEGHEPGCTRRILRTTI
jgi:MFS family permease